MTLIKSLYTNPPKAGKFIALFSDGSGAGLFVLCDNGNVLNAEGACEYENIEEITHNYSAWIDISGEQFEYFFEGVSDAPNT